MIILVGIAGLIIGALGATVFLFWYYGRGEDEDMIQIGKKLDALLELLSCVEFNTKKKRKLL